MTGIAGRARFDVDIDEGVRMRQLGRIFASGDVQALTLEIRVYQSGAPVDLSGSGVVGYFMRADQSTVVITGTAAGNTALLTLPESCYAVDGGFQVIIKATGQSGNETRTTVFAGQGYVTLSSTDRIIDPGQTIPSIEELLARIAEMEAATGHATSAAETARGAAQAANNAAESALNALEDVQQAASDADAAAQRATEATQNAESATKAANSAAQRAEHLADDVQDAVQTAQGAAESAEAAAQTAASASESANDAADAARQATESANTAAKTAREATQRATEQADYIGGITVTAHDIAPNGEASVEKSEISGHLHLDFGLVKGDPGAPNIIRGEAYPTLEALQAAVPSPAEGDQYNVGDAPPYHIYRYTGSHWEDQGQTQGPKGDPGENGHDGLSIGSVTVTCDNKSSTSPTCTVTSSTSGTNKNYTLAFSGLKGAAGAAGSAGATGPAGPAGPAGPTGPTGPAGTGMGTITVTCDNTSSTSPTCTVTSSTSGTNKNYTLAFAGLKGATGSAGATGPTGPTGPAGPTGPTGPAGAKGTAGTRGSLWYSGTKITGTTTTGTTFSSSGLGTVNVGDYYLNTSNGNVYRCTTAGAASVAKWAYEGSIKGATGATGSTGSAGSTGPQGPTGPAGTGMGTITVTCDNTSSTSPTCTVTSQTSGTSKNYTLAFSGLKGATGAAGASASKLDAWPVGSVYVTANTTSPGSLFGGTWTKLDTPGATLVAAGTVSGIAGWSKPEISAGAFTSNTTGYIPRANTDDKDRIAIQTMYSLTHTGSGTADYTYHYYVPRGYGVYFWKRTA